MTNPVGYLYRVGQSKTRPRRRTAAFPTVVSSDEPWFEPGLPDALNGLTDRERTAVILIEGYGWTYRDVAETAGIARSSVQVYFERGLAKLRTALGVREGEVRHE
ncbi:MAG: sigma factor-like helix-turn-helix DNA-binding protein [Acidimicrobiales bacterium]|nr:sigma factor-like helix-turn-helix DNA-binding protein [Acidimicrobiales bacterium]